MYERLTTKIYHLETEIAKKEQSVTNTKNEKEQLQLKQQMDQMNKELKELKDELEKLKTLTDTAMDTAMSAKATSRQTQKRQEIKVETVTQDMETLSRKHKALEKRVSISEDNKCKCQEKCRQAMQGMIEQTIQKQMANNKDECRQAMQGMIEQTIQKQMANNKDECRQAMQGMIEQTIQKQMANNKDECRQAMKDIIEETIQQQMADISGQIERQVSTAVESAMIKHTQHTSGEIEELKKHLKQEIKTLVSAQKRDTVSNIRSGNTQEPPNDRKLHILDKTRSQSIRETRPPSKPPLHSFLHTQPIPNPAASRPSGRQIQSSMGSRFPESEEHERGDP